MNKLADRSPAVVAEAANRADDPALIPELKAAFARLLKARDPGARARLATLRALHRLEEYDCDLCLEAVRSDDGELRGLGAVGLAQSGWPGAAALLVDLLVDPDLSTRACAVRGLAYLGQSLVLRLQARLRDALLGECLDGILRCEGAEGIPFVASFLSGGTTESAAMALGASRLSAALPPLQQAWTEHPTRALRRSLLLAAVQLRAAEPWLRQLAEEEWVAQALGGLRS